MSPKLALSAAALWCFVSGCSRSGTSDPEYGATLRPKIEAMRQELLAPAVVVVVRSPAIGDWTATFGTRARATTAPVEAQDHFRVGSCTKTWTGTVILQLVAEGRLSLDDRVARFQPEVPNGRNITVEQLLNMRSGLYNYSESLELNQALDETPQRVWQPDELLAIAFKRPPYFPPGQGYHYSNTNTVLLGKIIEQLTGKPVAQVFEERLFRPLGLKHTLLPPLPSNAIPSPHPRGYRYGTNVETIDSEALSAEDQAAARDGRLLPQDVTEGNPSWAGTAGAGISRPDELARYARALVRGDYLPKDLQQRRLTTLQPTDPTNPNSAQYGLALGRFGSFYGHTGELPGFNTFMGYDPDRDVALVVNASLASAPDGRPPAIEIARLIIAEIVGRDVPAAAAEAPDLPGNLQ